MDYTLRYDKGVIKQKNFTSEGFLKVDAVFTRTGVFDYRNNDGSIRKELRHPEDVFKDDSLKSMEMLPITLNHPKERVVDVENARKVQVGFTGEKINHDGTLISGTVLITDSNAIKAIEEDGVEELSLGYQVKLIEDKGEFRGERHDVRQTEIIYNHLALVPNGRAGVAKLHLDAADAVQTESTIKKDSKPKPRRTKMEMVQVNLDGINYEAAPEVANAFNKANGRADKAETNLKTLNTDHSKLQADFDTQKSKLDEAEKIDHTDAINKAVNARITLVGAALKHLDDNDVKDIEKKSDAEIQEMVIKKYSSDFNKDGKDAENIKNDVYMQARFDAALENTPKGVKNDNSSISNQRKIVRGNNNTNNDTVDLDKSRNDYLDRLTNGYKPETKAA